jgi:hypothetical protein
MLFIIVFLWVILALGNRFLLTGLLKEEGFLGFGAVIVVFGIGVYLIRKTASVIGDSTGVLKERTGLAGGLLQAMGTAFPDMVLGVVSAILSLQAASTDILRSINLAIIAASTTFGSNIYNIFHATWCLYRQNLANKLDKKVMMFPGISKGGMVTPISRHEVKPPISQLDASLKILVFLSLLTTSVALGMVLFGKVDQVPDGFGGDLYQLTKPLGFALLFISLGILFAFRKGHQTEALSEDHNPYRKMSTWKIWLYLLMSAGVILLAAESTIEAVIRFSDMTGIPYVLTGVLTALVGCLGEMLVIHDLTIHPKGRITDAVIGVAMDNIVTTMGASFIAILGGIFLGSDALIVIFVLILFANTSLMQQIAFLKNEFLSRRI